MLIRLKDGTREFVLDVDPQIEGQVSLDESSKQRQGDTLRRDRSEARGQECCGAVRLPGAKGRDHSRQGFR